MQPDRSLLVVLTALAAEAKAIKSTAGADVAGRHTQLKHGPHEYRAARRALHIRTVQCGMGRDRVFHGAALADAWGVGSIGISGGLAPGMPRGAIVLAERIVESVAGKNTKYHKYLPDEQLLDKLETALRLSGITYRRGAILCSAKPLLTASEKAAAHGTTGAIAVDMESGGAAAAAAAQSLPFFSVRVICDPAERSLDGRLLKGVDPEGNGRPLRMLVTVLKNPWLIVGAVRVARDFSVAMASLRRTWPIIQAPLDDFYRNRLTSVPDHAEQA
jgi:adenosylhomocysteine nucleosidase